MSRMRRGTRAFLVLMVVALAAQVAAQEPGAEGDRRPAPAVRFVAVNVYVDPHGQALAAYQFELAAEPGDIKIVGVEGGEHAAFADPPYYDPAALKDHRIIIAAFSLAKDLPVGKTRVARVHLRVAGGVQPEYAIKLRIAGSPEAKEISAQVSVEEAERK